MTKLSPRKYVGQMMGIWFLAASLGNLIAGLVGGSVDPEKLEQTPALFLWTAIALFASAVVLGLLILPIRRMMGTSTPAVRRSQPSGSRRASGAIWRTVDQRRALGAVEAARLGGPAMALEKYRAKRNFTESPEPSGDTARQSPPGRHRGSSASRSISPVTCTTTSASNTTACCCRGPCRRDRRSIRRRSGWRWHVEDHPIEYGDFEGVIPSGYGAGIVMLWDRGTWVPEVDDVEAALKKGDLKFTLDGVKLKGSWVLVRTKGGGWGSRSSGGGDRSWLLIKHRDDWAGPVDIAEFAPLSVKSNGDFADILASGNPDIWHSQSAGAGRRSGRDVRANHRARARNARRTSWAWCKGCRRARGSERAHVLRPLADRVHRARVRRRARRREAPPRRRRKRQRPRAAKNPRARKTTTRRTR